MNITTKHFGTLEVGDDKVILFDEGLPGFNNDKRFVILNDDNNDVFCWLQSVDDGETAFVMLNTFSVLPEYNPVVDEAELAALGDVSGRELLIYNIAVIPDDIKKMRVNLKAPIAINPITKKGKQVIATNEDYPIRHYIFDETENTI